MSEERVFRVMNDLIGAEVEYYKNKILTGISENPEKMIIDMEKVKVIDSSGIGMLVAARNSANNIECELVLKNVSQDIIKMFKIMRLTDYFVFED